MIDYVIWFVSLLQSLLVYGLISFILYKAKRGIWAKLMSDQAISVGIVVRGFIILPIVAVWLVASVPVIKIFFMFFNWMNHLI